MIYSTSVFNFLHHQLPAIKLINTSLTLNDLCPPKKNFSVWHEALQGGKGPELISMTCQ